MRKILLISILSLSFISLRSQSTDLAGFYKCSEEDMIRLNANGTGKFSISYIIDEIIQFKWKFDRDEQRVDMELLLTEEQKWKVANRYLSMDLTKRYGKQILTHPQGPITYEYLKQ